MKVSFRNGNRISCKILVNYCQKKHQKRRRFQADSPRASEHSSYCILKMGHLRKCHLLLYLNTGMFNFILTDQWYILVGDHALIFNFSSYQNSKRVYQKWFRACPQWWPLCGRNTADVTFNIIQRINQSVRFVSFNGAETLANTCVIS